MDEQTINNLKGIKADRKRLGLSRKKLSELTGINYKAISDYETGRYAPYLSRYLRLAEFFGWDIRDSPNYKFAMMTANQGLKKRKRSYGLSTVEISRLTNFSEDSIENALYNHNRSTIRGRKTLNADTRINPQEINPRHKTFVASSMA